MKTGIELIAAERQEQIEKHGYTVVKDVAFNNHYQIPSAVRKLTKRNPGIEEFDAPQYWDSLIWERMIDKTYKDRLIIAGALIAAEIDRIQFEKQEAGQ